MFQMQVITPFERLCGKVEKMQSIKPLNQRMANLFAHVTNELLQESDRGSVILSFAWIDEELTRVLQKFCLPSISKIDKDDELFGIGRPAGEASTKINLAFRLGLIRSHVHQSLHLIRRLRNDFAHRSSKLTFDTASVRDRIRTLFNLQQVVLNAVWDESSSMAELLPYLHEHKEKVPVHALIDTFGTKAVFAITSGTIVAGLNLLCNDVVTVMQPENKSE